MRLPAACDRNHVDAPWQPARQIGDEPRGLGVEAHRLSRAGDLQPMLDVGLDLRPLERRQHRTTRDALVERIERLGLERVEQRGLSDQDNLHQPSSFVFERRQPADLIEHLWREALRFVDDDDRVGIERKQRVEKALERVEQLWGIRVREGAAPDLFARDEPEITEHDAKDLRAGHVRVEDDRRERPIAERLEHAAAERRLARAGFAAEEQQRFTPAEPVTSSSNAR